MPIEVEGPDGRVHSFPDGTDNSAINAQMSNVYGGGGNLQAPGMTRPGDATVAAGANQPNSRSTPPYRSTEDWDQLMLSQMFPHAQTILQNTPGHLMRAEEAKVIGKDLGHLHERQRAGEVVLDMLHQLGETADQGSYQRDAQGKYLQDRDGNRIPLSSPPLNQAIGPLDSSSYWQRARAMVPLVGNYYEQGYNLHNQLNHDIEGLTTAFIAASGRGGVQMSDARQKTFQETMGAMMRSTSKAEFDKIKADAERIIAGTFGLAPGANVPATRSSRSAPNTTAAPARREQFRNARTGQMETFELTPQGWQKAQ